MLPFLKRVYGVRSKWASAHNPLTNHILRATDTVLGAFLWQKGLLETVPAKMETIQGKNANTDYPREREADRRDIGQTCRKGCFPWISAGVKTDPAAVLGTGQRLGLLKGSAIVGFFFFLKNPKAPTIPFELLKGFRNHNTPRRRTPTIGFPHP